MGPCPSPPSYPPCNQIPASAECAPCISYGASRDNGRDPRRCDGWTSFRMKRTHRDGSRDAGAVPFWRGGLMDPIQRQTSTAELLLGGGGRHRGSSTMSSQGQGKQIKRTGGVSGPCAARGHRAHPSGKCQCHGKAVNCQCRQTGRETHLHILW
jgi:hypothetical protein